MITISNVLQSLRPNAEYMTYGNEYDGIQWVDKNQTKPTKEEVDAEFARLQAEAVANAYKAKRAAEYPPITDYIDGVVKNDQAQIDKYIADCLAIKKKYPKGVK